ncbi:MAG: SsrA-binding protein SmpB [Bacteroidetes bacterium SB0662_bin_6]|nr:SsrA-binding protein SmpB [Bacteroidetes bacterium SB0668_bin_1]MYE04987.1 SsrA-binding protein SmpB [Bacteroidetes bacterium SB0662_bin_6]
MTRPGDREAGDITPVTKNRKAYYEYHVEETIEAGIALRGSEVKSVRQGKISLQEAWCRIEGGTMKLMDCHIAPYEFADASTAPSPVRPRQLLLHRRELLKWEKACARKGYTVIPLSVYLRNGYAKVKVGLCKGKKLHDRRASVAEREAKRRMERAPRVRH